LFFETQQQLVLGFWLYGQSESCSQQFMPCDAFFIFRTAFFLLLFWQDNPAKLFTLLLLLLWFS